MTTKNPGEATVRAAIERPVRMQTALAALPAASQAMRDELGRWMEMVMPTEGGAPTADVKYGASTDAAMVTTTWRISAGAKRIRRGLDSYFADFGVDDGEPARLDATLEMLGAQRTGIWIEMGDGALDTGWFFDEPFDVTKVFAVAGGGGSLGEKARAWATRHRVTRTEYVARSLGAKKPYHDIFLAVPTVDAALELVKSFDLPAPNALVEDGLRRGATETAGVSVRVTENGVTRVGVLARRPPTTAVLSLLGTRDQRDPKLLAVFEGALGVSGAAWAEYEIYSNRTNLELHYTLG
jgi:hypothetical protein